MAARTEAYPANAVSLSVVGGLVYLFVAIVVAIAGAVGLVAGVPAVFPIVGTVAGLAIVGVLTIVFGILLRRQPELALFWGALLVVLAILSLGLEFGGFVVGFLLTLVGGILAVAWKLGPIAAKVA